MAEQIGRIVRVGREEKVTTCPLTKFRRNKGWLTAEAQAKHEKSQMDYIIPHLQEYKIESTSEQPIPSGRKQRINIGAPMSVCEFDAVSTVQAPTEATFNEYTSTLNVHELRREFFSNYSINRELPIFNYRRNLVNSINSYSVVIVEGATGCGKTTQVPCYILEDAILEKNSEKAPVIYVTQPRRIAAKSIAKRVCEEHNWELGSLVGYQIGLEKVAGPQTALIFCTAGVLLQKLIQDKSLVNYTHIIIDEAHERDADTDLLMMMIRALMRKEKSFFRLLVMSATMDANKLKEYFTFPAKYSHTALTAPSLCVIGNLSTEPNTKHNVYFDAIRQTFNLDVPMPNFDLEFPELFDDLVDSAVRLVVDIIPNLENFEEKSKSTLIFLPGLSDIIKLDRLLRVHDYLEVIPLHSTISTNEQSKIFDILPPGRRKVILATNIAESSITVKDVGFIIDFCLTKTLRKDPFSKFPTLKLEWCSVDRCTQRGGRTGRCCNGKVFRMVSQSFFKQFREYAEPELLTAPLELSVLRVKNFQMGEIQAMFAVVLDPPPIDEIRTAVLELKQIGALSSNYQGKPTDMDGDLTELGRVISALPIDVHLSKLIVMASILDVLEPAIIVAACLSTNRSVVRNIYGNQLRSYRSKLDWARGSYSDLFVCLDVYEQFEEAKEKEQRSVDSLKNFCNNYNLDDKKLFEVSALVEELKQRLEQINIRIIEQPNRSRDRFMDEFMLKVAFCAAFYPHYFLTQDVDVRETKNSLCGQDPTKTVIIHGLPVNSAPLYYSQLVKMFSDIDGIGRSKPKIDYIADCSRAMLIFDSEEKMPQDECSKAVAGDIMIPSSDMERSVYLAIKRGETGERLTVKEYLPDISLQRMDYYNQARLELTQQIPHRLLPTCIKVVRDRRADNQRLLVSNREEYDQTIEQGSFVEVEFDDRFEETDNKQIKSLENSSSVHETVEKPIFKAELKFITGPTSPIGLKFRPVLEKCKVRSVDIDPLSVNSILLNPDYEKPRRQMLVAASVCLSKGGRILARDTTLMPNIRGLPTIMSLLFAQYYRLIYNDKTKAIAGGVFGLGWDESDESIDKEYEVELGFDTQITQDDIDLINIARQEVSALIRFIDIQDPGRPQAEKQTNLREILLKLLKKRRLSLQEVEFGKIDWSKGDFIIGKPNIPEDQYDPIEDGQTRVFLPTVKADGLYSEAATYEAIRGNLKTFERICSGEEKTPMGGIHCLLCTGGVTNKMLMRHNVVQHTNDDKHNQLLEEFEMFERRFYSTRKTIKYSHEELMALKPSVNG